MPPIPADQIAPYGAVSSIRKRVTTPSAPSIDGNANRPHGPPTIADSLLTISEFAKHCRVSVFTIRRAIRRGELRVIRVTPRRYVIRLSEGERYLVAREAAA